MAAGVLRTGMHVSEQSDRQYMGAALRLARRAAGRTSPNPMVGAVVVRQDRVVGRGHHARAGTEHAEVVALRDAGTAARGATLYVNLEPCSHFGRTAPCVRAVIEAGIRRVVAGMIDPNPAVAGGGVQALKDAGIRVDVPVREDDCRRLNEAFVKHVTRGLPFVTLKLAASLDGRIATATGDSRWVTGPAARRYVHRLRNELDAVLVGSGTVLADDPQLTCRLPGGRDPLRVVLDGRLRTPLTARLVTQPHPEKTVLVTRNDAPADRRKRLEDLGVQVWRFPADRGRVSFRRVLRKLARAGVLSVLVEGGAVTAARAVSEKAVDKVLCFYAPKFIGAEGLPMVGGLGIERMRQTPHLSGPAVRRVGEDILVSAYL